MNKQVKKICVITGTRADYGIYYPVLSELEQDDAFELSLIVTGMHLSQVYGNTIKEIEKDGFTIAAKVENLLQGATEGNMARSVGLGIMGMTQAFESTTPDLVMVLGDRGEMLAAAIAASHLNIPVAHIHGGEVSGSIDESVRHAITKLSHLHFPSTEGSAKRIMNLGEERSRVHRVGAPRIDTIKTLELPNIETIFTDYSIKFSPEDYLLFVFHPVSTEVKGITTQIEACMEALKELNKNTVVILPNSDAGNDKIFEVYDSYKNNEQFSFVTNFSPNDYLSVLKHARGLVGNSSSGIIEAASFQLPVVNIGTRQNGRDRSDNVLDVAVNKEEIVQAAEKALSPAFARQLESLTNIYGDGTASKSIVRTLKTLTFDDELIRKKITY